MYGKRILASPADNTTVYPLVFNSSGIAALHHELVCSSQAVGFLIKQTEYNYKHRGR
jgi:uncharacterized protein YbaR (Trm112 family)